MKRIENLVLVSSSPRRRELLERFAPKLEIVKPSCNESPVTCAEDLVSNAVRKLESAKLGKDAVAVSADTAGFLDGKALGKPSSPADAEKMLRSLSGRWHDVVTGVALWCDGRIETASETTRVKFRKLEPDAIRTYVATGEPLDKAGSYGIQGLGGLLVERIEGDYDNVVGLPLAKLEDMLNGSGLTLGIKKR